LGFTPFRQNLTQRLTSPDQLFRWSGPTFLAIIERAAPIEQVKKELHYLLSGKLENIHHVGTRAIPLPVNAAWKVLPLFEMGCFEIVTQTIDTFVSAQLPSTGDQNMPSRSA